MFSSNANLQNITSLYQLSQNGQVRVPVAPSKVMFANFSYINGVATSLQGDGPSVTQLHLINQMIERLYRQQELRQLDGQNLREQIQVIAQKSTSPQEVISGLRQLSDESNMEVVQSKGSIFDITI